MSLSFEALLTEISVVFARTNCQVFISENESIHFHKFVHDHDALRKKSSNIQRNKRCYATDKIENYQRTTIIVYTHVLPTKFLL